MEPFFRVKGEGVGGGGRGESTIKSYAEAPLNANCLITQLIVQSTAPYGEFYRASRQKYSRNNFFL